MPPARPQPDRPQPHEQSRRDRPTPDPAGLAWAVMIRPLPTARSAHGTGSIPAAGPGLGRLARSVLARPRALACLALTGLALTSPGAATAASAPAAPRGGAATLSWQVVRETGVTTERFRGLAAVSRQVAWAGGYDGLIVRTTDGGRTWQDVSPAGAEGLQFRDVEAFSADRAVALSIGYGSDSRVYVTDDGGASWTETFRSAEDAAFYDCLAFSTPQRGLAVSDPIDGKTRLAQTRDGGRTWSLVDQAGMVPALDGEYYFAASGTCLSAGQGQTTYLATGGGAEGRVLVSQDRGHTWSAATTPIDSSGSAGVFSVAFRDRHHGIAVGGDYTQLTESADNAAWSADGGRTWHSPTTGVTGFRSGSAWIHGRRDAALAVGPSGSDVTWDAGRTWTAFDSGSFDTVQCTADGACWASGELGRIAVLQVAR